MKDRKRNATHFAFPITFYFLLPTMYLSNANIPALTGLRAFAAGQVFFYHWFFAHAAEWPLFLRAPFEVGYVGVPIFFALSGFLITLRYEADFRNGHTTYTAYLLKRLIRVVPLYLFVLIFGVFAFGRPTNIMPTDGRQTLILLTLTQAFFPSTLFLGTTVGWTLTLEMLYYLLAPAFFRWLRPDKPIQKVIGAAVWLSAAAIGLGLLLSWWPNKGGDTLLGQPASFMMHYSIFGHLPDFLVGMVAAVLFLQSKPRPWLESRARWLVWGNVLGMYGCMVLLLWSGAELGTAVNRTLSWGVALFASGFILGTAVDTTHPTWPTRLLATRALLYLGATSYALYLIQLTEPVQWFFWLFLGKEMGITHMLWRAFWLYVLTIFISAALYELVERPVQRWLLSVYHSFRRPSD